MTLPPCPSPNCGETPLEAIRADGKGLVWAYCPRCGKPALVAPDGRILKQGDNDTRTGTP